jgi:two-component system sensor histidine kinase UhpB
VIVAGALLVVVLGVAALFPWPRVPAWSEGLPALAYLIVVALLRNAEGGEGSAVGVLAMLPLLWAALHGSRAQLRVTIVSVGILFCVPPLLVGAPRYPPIEWERAVLWTLVASVLGPAVQHLVRTTRRQAAALRHLAETDALTGLPNRRRWDDLVRPALTRAREAGEAVSLAVIDLDELKAINDRHGHLVGSRAIQLAAAEWRRLLDEKHTLARFGGDEFVLLLPGATLEQARLTCERLRSSSGLQTTASFGAALWDGSESYEALFGRADDALYSAKRQGRDRTCVHGDPVRSYRRDLPAPDVATRRVPFNAVDEASAPVGHECGPPPPDREAPAGVPLFWRVALSSGAVFSAAVLALALSPATVSVPVAPDEAITLAVGTVAVIGINLFALRRSFAPLAAVARQMASVDPLAPGARVHQGREYREISAITSGFNQMVDRLEVERRESALRAHRIIEAERGRVTRELHDEVGQTLTVLLLQLVHVARVAGPEAQERLEQTQQTARAALLEVRRIGHHLRPESLDDLGLRGALMTLADRVSAAAAIKVDAVIDEGLPELDQEAALAVFRIAQESLTNVMRHSGAATARVRLERAGPDVLLSVRDDGRVTAPPIAANTGIRSMRERALAIGGRLTLEYPRAGGVEVRLLVPRVGALA